MKTVFYPTRRTVALAAAAAPACLLVGLFLPGWWTAGLALVVLLIALIGTDLAASASATNVEAICEGPGAASVGERFALVVHLAWRGAGPAAVEIAIGADGPVAAPFGWTASAEMDGPHGAAALVLEAKRRGTIKIDRIWLRWAGPLGVAYKQRQLAIGQTIMIAPDIRPVREKSAQLINRDAMHGQVSQLRIGEGAEFESLADYRPGIDRRAIDWKQSARHTRLIAKEYRTERNNNIVMAVDCGRSMCEPIASRQGTIPRVDKAVTAALLTAFVALRDGDRVGLFAFDSRPRGSSRPISGPRAFSMLQRVAAGIDYSSHETNHTLAIATLAESLSRRSLIVVFTEFPDTISAELMVKAVGRLLKYHLVLFVVLKDMELEAITAAEPQEPDDISRAVTAAGLLRERRLVLTRLRHMGVQVIEAAADAAGPALVNAYLDLKRRGTL